MDGLMLPLIIAAAVALAVFAIVQVTASMTDGEKRRLKQRLSTENRPDMIGNSDVSRQITFQQASAGLLGNISIFDRIGKKLRQAYPEASLERFIAICVSIGAAVFGIMFLIMGSYLFPAIGAAVGFYLPIVYINSKGARRQKALADQLPEALDFLSRILRAGHSLSTGLQMMSDELPQPLAAEFRRAYDQHSLGSSMDDCLKDMSTRIESTDFAFFVTAVLIQRQTGGDLSEVLGNISTMIRQRIRLQNSVKAKTAEGRFTGYILTAFPGVMFFISYALNPDYAGVLIKTNTGLMLLGIAFGLAMMGLYCIKKITTVRV